VFPIHAEKTEKLSVWNGSHFLLLTYDILCLNPMAKKLIWLGFFVGSTVGSMVPYLWGADMLSFSSLVLSAIGGALGIWAGYKADQLLS
jgi:hypothetical protein